jgi:uncharacterized protein YPO0396
MKTLQKLRLINWHYFSNTTTDIKNITFLTGPNGTGKSTIIDALQILILGTTRRDNFNKAANEKGRSGRDLISYLRGQTGVKDDGSVITLRSGTFTSYIAIEIYDDVENRTFTLGACFDVDSSDRIDKHYFYLDSGFPENGFSNVDTAADKNKIRPMVYKELANYVRENYKVNHFRFFDTDTDYQNFRKEAFGNLPDKYFDLFKKAVSFSPISDISSFITEYICDADLNVDITPMQKNIEQYKILEAQAKNLRNKVECLQKIQETFNELRSFDKRINMLNYVNARVSYEESKKKIDNLNEKLKKDNDRLTYIGDELGRLDSQLEDLNSDLNSYNAKKLQSNNYSLVEKLSLKKDNVLKQITTIQMQVSNVVTSITRYCQAYETVCYEFANYYRDFDASRLGESIKEPFDELVELCLDISSEAKNVLDGLGENDVNFELLASFKSDMEQMRNQAISMKSLLNTEFYNASRKLQSLQSDLAAVSQGKKPFDKLGPVYMNIKEALETSLKARHSDAYVHIYCDLVDVNDPEWTMALEAVLFNQKFNFFVNPRYYEEANRLLKELTDNYHYYHVALVDTERLLQSDIRSNDDSIAHLIDTSDKGARAYTDYLLGRIKKCSTFEEARASGSGLLSDCTGYRSFATWYVNKANARIFYLGRQVSSNAKAVSTQDYQNVNQQYSLISEALNKLQNLLALQTMSDNEFVSYQNDVKRSMDISDLQNQVLDVESEMKKVSNGDMSGVDERITEIQQQIRELNQKRNDLLTERGQVLADTKRINGEDLPACSATLKDNQTALSKFEEKVVNEEYEPFFNKLLDEQGLTLAQIRVEAYRESVQAQNKTNRDRGALMKLRSDYCAQFHLNYDVQNEKSNEEFDKELENISKVMLPDYEKKIEKAHEDSIREFKDDFVYKLRTAIETVYSQIEELNGAMKDSRFGRDTYQFKVSPNKDYIEYYNMIMDPLLLKAGDAENLFMEKYKGTMDDLFNLISSSTSSSGEQREQVLRNINTFTTYTTYIVFDLLVKRGLEDDAPTISMGKSFTKQSGGESQTPFYISILASFAQLCRVNNAADSNTLRLVLFDEAFSKMDATRIKKSTDLLRQFGLQCILSTPSEKLRDLVSCVDLILVTIHEDKRKRSYIDIYQEKEKREGKALPSVESDGTGIQMKIPDANSNTLK